MLLCKLYQTQISIIYIDSIYWICSWLTAGQWIKFFVPFHISQLSLAGILLNSEEVDEPPVTAAVLLDLPPLLHPPPPLVRQLEHVLVDVAVLLHDLRVLLGHHVDHNTTRLAKPGHRGKAAKGNMAGSKTTHHDNAVIGATEQLAGHLQPEGALDHLVVHRPLLVHLLLGAVEHLSAEVETSYRSESSLGKGGTNCSGTTGHIQHFQLVEIDSRLSSG